MRLSKIFAKKLLSILLSICLLPAFMTPVAAAANTHNKSPYIESMFTLKDQKSFPPEEIQELRTLLDCYVGLYEHYNEYINAI
jgi:hypothetical protein